MPTQNIPSAIVPMPLWERHQLFQEPDFPEGLAPYEDDQDIDE